MSSSTWGLCLATKRGDKIHPLYLSAVITSGRLAARRSSPEYPTKGDRSLTQRRKADAKAQKRPEVKSASFFVFLRLCAFASLR